MESVDYIGSSHQEMNALEWAAYENGYACATSADAAVTTDADAIAQMADDACARAVATFSTLDREAFHEAYTYGWIAGYLAACHQRALGSESAS